MKARPAVIVASVLLLIGVWVVVLLHALPTTDDRLRLPSSGAAPATSPAPLEAAPTLGPIQAGPAGAQPGKPAAGESSSAPDQEDLSENDVEDEPQPPGGSGGGLTGLTAGLAIVPSPLGHPSLPSPPALPVR